MESLLYTCMRHMIYISSKKIFFETDGTPYYDIGPSSKILVDLLQDMSYFYANKLL